MSPSQAYQTCLGGRTQKEKEKEVEGKKTRALVCSSRKGTPTGAPRAEPSRE